jgi:hypothetical protein
MMTVRSKLTSGVVGLLVLGAGGWAAAVVPSPLDAGIAPLHTAVQPDGVHRHLVCAGAIAGHSASSAEIIPVGHASFTTMAGNRIDGMTLAGANNGSIIAQNSGKVPAAATESVAAHDAQLVGYLASECGDAVNDQWLVGGSTETGRESTLVLSNGTDVDARVDLEIWGENGSVDAPGSKGIVVPAHSQRAYSVAGFIPNEPSPALHVISTGAAIWATLQVSVVRGLVPGGLDRIGSVNEPDTTLAFPEVQLPTDESIGEVLADPDYADVEGAIRLLNPGVVDAAATITLIPSDGGKAQSVTATVNAGVVTDIGLSDFAPGDWSIVVTSDQPLVGAIRTGFHDPASGVTDIAWESAAPIHRGSMSLAVPSGASLGIVNSGSKPVDVSIVNSDLGTKVTIPAGGSIMKPVEPGAVLLDSNGPIAANIAITTTLGIATVRALPEPHDAGAVSVIFG